MNDCHIGTYIVRETKVPENMSKVEDFKVVIEKDSSEPQVWRVFNDEAFTSVLAIVKKDTETNKTVQIKGAKFKIKNLDTGKYFGYWEWNPLPHYVDSWVTDDSGSVMTGDKLRIGRYQLEEIAAPEGYLISPAPIPFEIKSGTAYEMLPDQNTVVITVQQKDISAKGKVNVEKYGEVLSDFKDGKFIYQEKGLANAEFEIIAREDILDPANDKTVMYKKGMVVDTIITSENGKGISKEIPLGEYSIRESKSPEGFILNSEEKDFSLKYKDENTEIIFMDTSFKNERQKVDLNIIKKDSKSDKRLEGAIFELYAKSDIINYKGDIIVKEGQLIETAKSDENGNVHFVLDLPLAEFEAREVKSPLGYQLSNEVIEINALYKGEDVQTIILEYEFKNDKVPCGIVKVKKKDSFDKNKKLENIEFNISSEKDMSKVITTVKTNREGIAIFEDLVLGTYYIQESRQVDGYILNDTIYQVKISEDGEILNINCENKPTEITFSKLYQTGKNELPGAKIQIIDKETGKVIEEWISAKEPHTIHYLTEGREYIMREIIAPEGYKLAEEIVFTAGDGQKVTMKDELKTIVQTGNETNYFLLISCIIVSVSGLIIGMIALKRNRNRKTKN